MPIGFDLSKTFQSMPVLIDFGDIPPVAAQDLSNVLMQGYLEKKRKGITTDA